MSSANQKTILVAGALANKPHNGGEAWVRLNWILGLRELGFRVWFVEQIRADRLSEANREYFDRVTRGFGLSDTATLICGDGERTIGADRESLFRAAGGAALLVNISGNLAWPELLALPRVRAFVDLDPGYTQAWHASGNPNARIAGHDAYFSVGMNVGSSGCSIPSAGLKWNATLPPVTLSEWSSPAAMPASPLRDRIRFTTVASWRNSLGRAEIGGRTFGMKCHEFRKLLELPQRVDRAGFEIALDIHPDDAADRAALESSRWKLTDPRSAASTPEDFRRYVRTSSAEFSPAQGVYVETRSGWFSDRTACYLASGRPALVQETGISRHLPVGEGLLTFSSLDEAIEGANRIVADYDRHARAARAIAERHLDSRIVLGGFLKTVGVA